MNIILDKEVVRNELYLSALGILFGIKKWLKLF